MATSHLIPPRHRRDVPVDSTSRAEWPFDQVKGLHRWTGADPVEWRKAETAEVIDWIDGRGPRRTRLVAGVGLLVPA